MVARHKHARNRKFPQNFCGAIAAEKASPEFWAVRTPSCLCVEALTHEPPSLMLPPWFWVEYR